MYQQVRNILGEINQSVIKKTNSLTFIPFDPANTDYQEYQAWLAEGNEPLPADD